MQADSPLIQGIRNPVKGFQKYQTPLSPSAQDSKLHSVMWYLKVGRGGRRCFLSLFVPGWDCPPFSTSFLDQCIKKILGSLNLYIFIPDLGHLICTGALPKANRRVYIMVSTSRSKPEQIETKSSLSSGSIAWTQKASDIFDQDPF